MQTNPRRVTTRVRIMLRGGTVDDVSAKFCFIQGG